jgi:hypothetical protein
VVYFDLADRSDMFLLNMGLRSRTTRRYIQEDRALYSHHCENLKYYKKYEVGTVSCGKISMSDFAVIGQLLQELKWEGGGVCSQNDALITPLFFL